MHFFHCLSHFNLLLSSVLAYTAMHSHCGNFHLNLEKLITCKRFLWSFSLETTVSWMVKKLILFYLINKGFFFRFSWISFWCHTVLYDGEIITRAFIIFDFNWMESLKFKDFLFPKKSYNFHSILNSINIFQFNRFCCKLNEWKFPLNIKQRNGAWQIKQFLI